MTRVERKPKIPEEGEIPTFNKVRALRWAHGVSISQLRELLGGTYSISHLSHIETGSEQPSDELLGHILLVFGKTREEFDSFTREELRGFLENGSPAFQRKSKVLGKFSETNPQLSTHSLESPLSIVETLAEIRDEIKNINASQILLAERMEALTARQEFKLETPLTEPSSVPSADILVF